MALEFGSWADWFSGTMSAVAVIVALSAYPLTTRARRREQREREKEVGRAIGWKALRVLNQTADIDRHITAELTKSTGAQDNAFKFQFVRPLGGATRPLMELNQEEIDFLLKARAADLLMEIDMCVGRYASIIYAMDQYKLRHEALYELMPTPIANQGTQFTHALSAEEGAKILPYAHMLDALLTDAISLIRENIHRANEVISQYNNDMKRHFGKPLMVFEIDPAVESEQSK